MKRGFTLIETLISMGIAATVGVLIAQVFFTTTKSNTKTEALKEVKQSGERAISSMERMIRSASNIVSTCTDTGTTLSSVQLANIDGGVTTLGCELNSSVTRIASTSATTPTEYLTSTDVTLGGVDCDDSGNTLSFVCVSYPDKPSIITIYFTLNRPSAIDLSETANVLFQTTVTLRN